MSEYLNEMIGYQVQGSAEWRREKARQFPDDHRNLVAAEELEKLAAEIDQIDDVSEPISAQIRDLHESLNRAMKGNGDAWVDIGECVSIELRSIGFHSGYENALQLLEWYRDLLREKSTEFLEKELDEAVPAPDLHEQVENDPTVKAAKQAYDAAYAKAYAEARRKL